MKTSKKTIGKLFLGIALATSIISSANAQFSVGADIVSNYVWRGVQQDLTNTKGTPNIQPSLSYSIGNFTIGTWGSYGILGSVKEVDVYASYAFTDFLSLTLTDYNWGFTQSYFNYGAGTDHVYEASISYAGIEKFPLSVSLSTMFYGADPKSSTDASQAYSTYVELGYPICPEASLFLGASLFESATYGTSGFGITNIGIKATKEIKFSDSFSLPVYGIIGVNPTAGDAFLVAGITF